MIDNSVFIHPEDEAALKTLQTIPGVSYIFKKILEYGYEKMYYGENLASSIKLSPTQLPHIYRLLPPICEKLGIEEPEFYLQMNPMPNAYTFGDTYKFICITSGLIEMATEDEITSVLAHECGHIICRHSLYHTMAKLLLSKGSEDLSVDDTEAIILALMYWQRKSELSCDRVAAVVTSPNIVSRSMATFAGGPKSIIKNINMEEWASQADEYHKLYNDSNFWDRAIQLHNTLYLSHPFAAVRVREICKWGKTSQYDLAKSKLQTSKYKRCNNCGRSLKNEGNYCEFCGNKIY